MVSGNHDRTNTSVKALTHSVSSFSPRWINHASKAKKGHSFISSPNLRNLLDSEGKHPQGPFSESICLSKQSTPPGIIKQLNAASDTNSTATSEQNFRSTLDNRFHNVTIPMHGNHPFGLGGEGLLIKTFIGQLQLTLINAGFTGNHEQRTFGRISGYLPYPILVFHHPGIIA